MYSFLHQPVSLILDSGPSTSHSSSGIIAGSVIGSLMGLLLLLLIGFMLWKKRKQKYRNGSYIVKGKNSSAFNLTLKETDVVMTPYTTQNNDQSDDIER
jgi:LPXTG-motif cell wall-anchored protein